MVTSAPWTGPTARSGFEGLLSVGASPAGGDRHTLTYQLLARHPTTLRIFDITGRLVKDFGVVAADPGTHQVEWDGRSNRGRRVAAGVYVAHLVVGSKTSTTRVVVLH